MRRREERLAAVRARLARVEARRDLSPVLDRRALTEARRLAETLQDDGDGGDLRVRYELGRLHWYRAQALPAGRNQEDLDTAIAMFTSCFLAGVEEPLPPPLLPRIADRAAPEVLARLEHAIAADDDTPLSVTTPLVRRVLAATPPGHPDRAARLSNLGLALRVGFERTGTLPDLQESIDAGREAVAATPAGHPNTALYLNHLGCALQARYMRSGTPSDLEGAVDASRRAVAGTPPRQRNRALFLSNLALSLRVRFELTGALPDLEEAIGAGREAVAITPAGNAAYLNALRLALQDRFIRTGASADLEEAIDLGRRAVAASPTGHRRRPLYLHNLGLSLRTRFERTGALPDLEEAVEAGREAVATAPARHPDRPLFLSVLGVALQARFGRTGMVPDLDDAIDAARESVAAVPAGHPNIALYLNNLGHALQLRFGRTGQASDLDGAVDAGRESVAAMPAAHPDRALYLHNLASALYYRFQRTGVQVDLEEAVGASRQAVAAVPADHPQRARYLSMLGLALQARFGRTGGPPDLDEAIDTARESLATTPADHPNRILWLGNLGAALQARFERRGTQADLDEAIDIARESLATAPADHLNQVLWLNNLGVGLQTRFGRTGELADLDEAIDVARQAVTAVSTGRPDRARYLANLAGALRARFGHVGALADLDEAIATAREALTSTPADHPDRGFCLSNLGVALQTRFERTREPADLDEAIATAREAVTATPADRPDRDRHLGNLGVALHIRFERTGEPADLDEAIETARAAVHAIPADHPSRAMYLHNLASALRAGCERTGEPAELDEAAETARAAVAATPADHPSRTTYLDNLGRTLRTRYERAGAPGDLEAALSAFEGAARVEPAAPSVRISAGRAGAALAARSDPGRAAGLLEEVVRLLPTVAPRGLERGDQQYAVGEFAGLAADAAALTLAGSTAPADQRAVRALQLLETGRAVLLSQALETRDDLTELRERHPDLAARFTELRELLDRPAPAAEPVTPQPGPATSVIDATTTTPRGLDRRRLAGRFAALGDEIRGLEGFSSFARPPATDELLGQAAYGPVVTFNVSSYRSDALILTADGVTALDLPDLTLAALSDQVKDFYQALRTASDPDPYADRIGAQARLRQILRWLWEAAAEPVLRALGHLEPPGDLSWPRVWWAPGGLLGLLPLHAAGHHSSPADPLRRTVMDRVVSSYTPTIGALRHARRHTTNPPAASDRALIVAMPTTPGLPGRGRLANVAAEASMLATRLPHSVLLSEPGDGDAPADERRIPTRANVLAHLPGSAIAHFACHGHSESADPSRSRLLLHDHQTAPLSVAGLAAVALDHARLAYLSACATAVTRATRLVDESIHLTSAFQLAGYPHVIGTLWEINDGQAVTVADVFYATLTTGAGTLDTERAAYALHHAVRTVRETCAGTPSLWAAYLHAGA